jgi:hypothetical protein
MFASVDDHSGMSFNTDATEIIGGTIVDSGYATTIGRDIDFEKSNFIYKLPLTINLDGTIPDTLSVVVTSVDGSSTSVGAALSWTEHR